MGRILIGGTAALLICIFLSPKFIEFLRRREFGQHIREDGPQGHLEKAGTPTMGGIIIFVAVAIPYLILSEFRMALGRRLRDRDRLRVARLRRRLHKARQAPLARSARTYQARNHNRDLAGALVRGKTRGRSGADAAFAFRRLHRRPRRLLSGAHLFRGRRHHQRRQSDRRPRRARGRLRRDRAARLHRHHVHRRRLRSGDARRRCLLARASAFSGSTRSRPRSSWAIPDRLASVARSPVLP